MAVAHWPRRPLPSARRLSPQLEGAARSLKASRETSPLHRSRPVPGYGACRFRRACAVKRVAEAVSGILPREDKAIAIRVLSLSEPSASRSGPAISTLIRKVSGLRRYRPGRFVREAAMTNAGSLAGMRRCMSPHVFAIVMARSGRLLSVLGPMAPSMPAHKDHEKDVGAEACPRSWVEKKARDGGHVRRLTPSRGGGPKGLRPDPERRVRP
jgi:hypothetical protein